MMDILMTLIDADPEQPRKTFNADKLAELAQSMDTKGLVMPIVVRPVDGRFVIVCGERRYRAAVVLGWETIRAEVRDVTPGEARWLALIENVQRQDLSPIEEALAYRDVLTDEGVTQSELGARIGKSQSYIAQKLRLLALPIDVQEALDSDKIKEGHARQLLKLKYPNQRSELCYRAIAEGWTVRRCVLEVNEVLKPPQEPSTPAEFIIHCWEERGRVPGHDPYPEERLPDHEDLGPPVEIKRLSIREIIDDPSMDPRTDGRDMSYPEWLAEIFVTLPPIAVFDVDGEYILADGRYRVAAATLLGLEEINCRIYECKESETRKKWLEVYIYGAAANCGGGLRLTKEDLQRTLAKRIKRRIKHGG